MMDAYPLQYIQLQVRTSNRAALSLYRDALGYTVYSVDHTYCESSWLNFVTHRTYTFSHLLMFWVLQPRANLPLGMTQMLMEKMLSPCGYGLTGFPIRRDHGKLSHSDEDDGAQTR